MRPKTIMLAGFRLLILKAAQKPAAELKATILVLALLAAAASAWFFASSPAAKTYPARAIVGR